MESTPVRIEELLAHAGWVRSLASRLVRDPATAEDVTQEVWASALSAPPRERSNLRGWLSAAVRSTVHSMQRGEQRCRTREEIAHVEREQAGPAELFERAQLHRELVEQVLALDEPHRSLVLAHWFEGSSVAKAGRRLGLTERVARLRLDAAHEILRQGLDRKHGGRESWSLVFLEWTRSNAAGAGSSGLFAAGGIFLATKLFAASAAALVLATLAFVMWPRDETNKGGGESLSSATSAATPLQSPPDAVAPAMSDENRKALSATPQVNPAPAAAGVKPRWLVRGHVSGESVNSLERTTVSVQLLGQFAIEGKSEASASKDGSFEIELTSIVERWPRDNLPNELLLTTAHPLCLISQSRVGFETAEIDARDATLSTHVFHCDVTLTTAAVVTGRVIVPPDWTPRIEGRGVKPQALRVGLYDRGAESHRTRRPFELAECDAQGRFTLHANHTGTFDIIATTLGLQPESKSADLILGKSIELAPITLTRGSSISGTVLRNGRPIGAGIEIYAELKGSANWDSILLGSGSWEELQQRDGEILRTRPWAITDADGRYSLDGLAPAEYELRVASLPETRVGLGGLRRVERTVLAPQEDVELRLLPPLIHFSCTIDGLATSDRGMLFGERLTIVPLGPDGRALDVEAFDVDLWGCQGNITVNPAVAYEFRIVAGRFEPTLVFVPALTLSEERDLKMDLKPRTGTCTLVVRFALNPGDEIAEPQFALVDLQATADAEPKWRTVQRGNDGAYLLENLPAGQFFVRVQPYAPYYRSSSKGAPYLGAEFSIELAIEKKAQYQLPLELGSRVRLCAKDERGGYVRAAIELRNARGNKLKTEFYCISPDGGYGCGWYLCEQGINDHPPLPAGHYELKLTADGFEDATASFDLIRGETTTLEIPMRHR